MISGIANKLPAIDQMISGLTSFGVAECIRSHKNVMQPLFTLEGAKQFQPTSDMMLDGLKVDFSEDGSNVKATEMNVYKHFCDYVQDLGMTEGTIDILNIIVYT